MKRICVIGSLNVDLTVRLPRFHAPGETIIGSAFDVYTGGKGGNQAVAAARLGADVCMAGKLGADENGSLYRRVLSENGVDVSKTATVNGVPSGVALIEVDAAGENRIAIVQGANALVDCAFIDALLPGLLAYDIFLMQLEIPLQTVAYATKILRDSHKTVILDPAPAMPLPQELMQDVNYLTPNESELSLLAGMPTKTDDEVIAAGKKLVAEEGAQAVVAKRGSQGVTYIDRDVHFTIPAMETAVVDTTAAGDSFNAGFAYALAKDMEVREALRFANAVGALSTMGAGAQQAMPTLEQVMRYL